MGVSKVRVPYFQDILSFVEVFTFSLCIRRWSKEMEKYAR